MKKLKEYIIEGHSFLVNKKLKSRQTEYEYFPATKDELQDIIIDLLKQGKTDLNCIDVSKITEMKLLFHSVNYTVTVTDIDISEWNVSKVTNMYSMFDGCRKFNSDLSNWDVSNVTDTWCMFYECEKFNSDLSKWDVSNVDNMKYMFWKCREFNFDLSDWNVSNVIDMHNMFDDCDTLIKNNKIPVWYKVRV